MLDIHEIFWLAYISWYLPLNDASSYTIALKSGSMWMFANLTLGIDIFGVDSLIVRVSHLNIYFSGVYVVTVYHSISKIIWSIKKLIHSHYLANCIMSFIRHSRLYYSLVFFASVNASFSCLNSVLVFWYDLVISCCSCVLNARYSY